MVYSMTGYGRAQQLVGARDITVEVRSVNHRFFEFNARFPRTYGYLEEKLKGFVHQSVSRGKVDVNVAIVTLDDSSAMVEVNRQLARGYVEALRALGGDLHLDDDLSLESVSRLHDIFVIRKAPDDENEIWNSVRTVAEQALVKYQEMRAAEGEKLAQDVLHRLTLIERHVEGVEQRSPQTVEEYRARLYAKLTEVLQNTQIDEQRILTEAAVFSEKVAVAEETVRLRSHIAQMRDFLASGQPVGRKLDFLVQELNREANTIGSKAQDVAITKLVVEIKSEIEKIREQIQNVE